MFCCNFYNFLSVSLTSYLELCRFFRYNSLYKRPSPDKRIKREGYVLGTLTQNISPLMKKVGRSSDFFCYNGLMDYVSPVISAFWEYHVAFASVLVPVLVIYIVFKFIRDRFK